MPKRQVHLINAPRTASDAEKVGHQLASLRKLSGLSQRDLAARLGTTQPHISRIEKGIDLHLSTLKAFAGAVGAQLRVEAAVPPSSPLGQRILDLFDAETDDDNQLVLPLLEEESFRPSRDVVLSIKPNFSAAILEGRKTVELRRRFPRGVPPGTLAFIYSTSPEKALIGTAAIEYVQKADVSRLWTHLGAQACIERADFDRYFEGQDQGFALYLRDPQPLGRALTLEELRGRFGFEPPQSFLYAKPDLRNAIQNEFAEIPH